MRRKLSLLLTLLLPALTGCPAGRDPAPPSAQPARPAPAPGWVILSDFEGGDPLGSSLFPTGQWKGGKRDADATSTCELDSATGAGGTGQSMKWTWQANGGWADAAFRLSGSPQESVDISAYDSVAFYIKGLNRGRCGFLVRGGLPSGTGRTFVDVPVEVTAEWQRVVIDLTEPRWDKLDLADIFAITFFVWPQGQEGNVIWADEIAFHLKDGVARPPQSPAEARRIQTQRRWRKTLEGAKQEFLRINDRESAELMAKVLSSLEQPNGTDPAALASLAERISAAMRELIRRGALDSAGLLSSALTSLLHQPEPGADGPIRPNPAASSGKPGPGGLVLHLPFDAPPANGVVRDESGAGNHGRLRGAQWVREGRSGGAYRFCITNVTDAIIVPDSDSLNVPYVTVAAWVKTSDADAFWNRVVDKDHRKGYNLCLGGDYENNRSWRGEPIFESKAMWTVANRPIGDGRWHHLAGTYDGRALRLYVDGARVKQTNAGKPGPIPRNHWDLCVGNSVVDYGSGEFLGFDGLIDDVRVYNRALSPPEIKALAATPAAAGVPEAQPQSATERLKKLKELFEQGLINKETYDQKSKELIDAL